MAKSVTLKTVPAISNKALKEKDLPSRLKVLNWGKNKTLDGEIMFDDESAKVFYANQKSIGRTMAPLDFNHNTVPGTRAYDGEKEPRAVAGYGIPTVVKGDGVYLDLMHWTPSGEKSARDFADLSPAVITDEDNRVIGMHSCALTPAGAIDNLSFFSADTMTGLMQLAAVKTECMNTDDHPADCDCADCKEKRAKMKVNAYNSEDGSLFYADEKNKMFQLDTEEHVRGAWRFLQVPKNVKGYSAKDLSKIRERISAKAKTYGIELKAESADDRIKPNANPNAYKALTPYEALGVDMEIGEHLDYFRKALGLKDGATPDDIMKAIRAKWEGMEDEKQTLPFKTADASVDPQIRNNGPLDQRRQGTIVTSFSAEEKAAFEKDLTAKFDTALKAQVGDLGTKLTTLTASLDLLKTERDAKTAELEAEKRKTLIANASRDGKIIPLSDEQIGKLPVAVLEEMVNKLEKKQVPMAPRELKPLTADSRPVPWSTPDGKIPELQGAAVRGRDAATSFFASQGVRSTGQKPNLSPI